MEYNRPYKEEKIQNEVFSKREIGFKCERSNYSQFCRLNKLQRSANSFKRKEARFYHEITRILTALHLPLSKRPELFKKVKKIHDALTPGTKYRNPKKLVPITIYMYMKENMISVNKYTLLKVSEITKKEFNSFLITIKMFFPRYDEEKRIDYITQKIMEISEEYNLNMEFYFFSKKILHKLWDLIKHTTEDVIAGLVCSITTLCAYRDKLKVNEICRTLGIQMSTIQFQVKKRIFETFNIPRFQSLVRSADLLRTVIFKLGIKEKISEKENTEKEVGRSSANKARKNRPQKSESYDESIESKVENSTQEDESEIKENPNFILLEAQNQDAYTIYAFYGANETESKSLQDFTVTPILFGERIFIQYTEKKGPPY